MSNLPMINKLHENAMAQIKDEQKIVVSLLNENPPIEWVKKNPYAHDSLYLPIDKVEYLLNSIFPGKYKIEITDTGIAFNAVYVSVRLHYRDLLNGDWMFHDGIGAKEIQVKSGSSPADLQNINNGALGMAFPIAKTRAIKDAADHFGKLFGSDLNRKDFIEYDIDLTLQYMDENHPNWLKVCEAVKSGNYKVSDISDKYTLTEESRIHLTNLQNGTV